MTTFGPHCDAIESLTPTTPPVRTAAIEGARFGVRANAIAPGSIDTPMMRAFQVDIDAVGQGSPMKRLGKPEDVAAAVRFFASEGAAYITGQTLSVSGGLTMA